MFDTHRPLPSIAIIGAWQEPNRVEILFRHPNHLFYRAVIWQDVSRIHPERAWTIELYSYSYSTETQFHYLYERGCDREWGVDRLVREMVRVMSVSVLPSFD